MTAGPVAVTTSALTVDGGGLGRDIEVTRMAPDGGAVRGVLVWCHGLGGSSRSGAGLAAAWAQRGYVVHLPTFADSIGQVARDHPGLGLDPASADLDRWALDPRLRNFLVTSMLDWPWRRDRILTLRAVLDALPALIGGDRLLAGRADPARVGVGGHSFGAYLSQLVAGVRIDCPLGPATSFRDERVVAVVIASGQGRHQAGLGDGSWDEVEVPLLNLTGTRDRGATSDDPAWKCEPFLLSPPGGRYQLVLDGADHGLGGVGGGSGLFPPVPAQLRVVEDVTGRFWDASVGGDRDTRAWIDGDGPALRYRSAGVWSRR